MTGADVCGFTGFNATEELCARWARLGAFYTFFRNHNDLGYSPQEFYRWPTVAESARKAIDLRYRLLDYIYTAFHKQSQTGEPALQPLFYLYPTDQNTFSNELQFFYGDSIMVSPVTDEGLTSVDMYFPNDVFYEWYTGAPVRGQGANVTLENIGITDIPVHIRGGSVIPIRAASANTTKELRTKAFQLIIAPDLGGMASGNLYVDDGESIEQRATLEVQFHLANGQLQIQGQFGGYTDTLIESVILLGQKTRPSKAVEYDPERQTALVITSLVLDKPGSVTFQ